MLQRLYDFLSGTRISSQQVDDELNQLVNKANDLETADTKLVPYIGTTKSLNMNGHDINDLFGVDFKGDGTSQDWFSRFDIISGEGRFQTRLLSGNLFLNSILSWDRDGILSIPNQSFVHVNSSGTQSISSGVETKVTILTSESSDIQSEFASGRFTAKRDGKYLVRLHGDWGATVPTGTTYAKAYRNGANWGILGYVNASQYVMGLAIVNLLAGEYLEFYIYQNSSGTAKTLTSAQMQVAKIA